MCDMMYCCIHDMILSVWHDVLLCAWHGVIYVTWYAPVYNAWCYMCDTMYPFAQYMILPAWHDVLLCTKHGIIHVTWCTPVCEITPFSLSCCYHLCVGQCLPVAHTPHTRCGVSFVCYTPIWSTEPPLRELGITATTSTQECLSHWRLFLTPESFVLCVSDTTVLQRSLSRSSQWLSWKCDCLGLTQRHMVAATGKGWTPWLQT